MLLWTLIASLSAQHAEAPPTPSGPTEADIEAVMQRALAPTFEAFSTCISTGLQNAPRRGSVPRAAAAIMRRCRPQQQALIAAHTEFLDNAPLTDARRAQSRGAWAESQRALQGQIEAALTGLRQQQGDDN